MQHRFGSPGRSAGIMLSVVLVLAAVFAGRAQSAWTVTDLGTLGGLFGDAQDVNDAGHVVGESSVASGDGAFLWTPSTGITYLGTLGGSRSEAQGLNNAGQVVGVADLANAEQRAFLWTADGGMIDLGVLGELFPGFAFSGAHDINELGHVVGVTTTQGSSHAFLWTPALGMIDLGTLGGANSSAWAINDAGLIVGRSDTASGEQHAFLWTPGIGMVSLGTLGGASSSAADINEAGQVVGRAETASGEEHAFLWTPTGGMIDLGTLGGEGSRSQAEGINDVGEVVGLFTRDDDRAFYWTATGGMIELPTLTGIESGARAINNAGQAAGYGDIVTGDAHAVIWNRATSPPTPEEQITSLAAAVENLVADGDLKPGQATGLTKPLQNALRSLARGQVASACAQLGDFSAEVARKVADGALTPAEGAALSALAMNISAALGC